MGAQLIALGNGRVVEVARGLVDKAKRFVRRRERMFTAAVKDTIMAAYGSRSESRHWRREIGSVRPTRIFYAKREGLPNSAGWMQGWFVGKLGAYGRCYAHFKLECSRFCYRPFYVALTGLNS